MNARGANLIAKRYQERKQALDDLHKLLQLFFRRTYLADSMNEARHAKILCGWLSDYGDFDELHTLIGEIRRDGRPKRFTSLSDIPTSLRKHFDETDANLIEFANEMREKCRDGCD